MLYCTECGTPFQTGMVICTQCGKPVSDRNAARASTDTNARTVAVSPSSYQVPFPAMPLTRASLPPATGYDSRQAYQQSAPQVHPVNMPSSDAPYATPPLQPLLVGRQQSKGEISKGVSLLLVLLAFLMISGGAALIYYTVIAQPTQFRAQATATVQTILATDARLTAVAQTQGTVTAQLQVRGTATAQAQAQATATVFQNIYNTATSGAPALTSSLAFQDRANWDIYSVVGGGGCAFSGNALHASIFHLHTYVPCFAQATNFSNFALQVQMTILKGDGGGLVFRADDVNAKFYLFRVTQNGVFSLLVTSDARTNTPLADDSSTAIKTGARTNLVTLIARGGTIYMYINKQFVGSTNDTTYTSGKIGIFADDTATATDVAFSNISVWVL